MNSDLPDYHSLRDRLVPFDQGHLLAFWGELNTEQRMALARQIESLDLELVRRLFLQASSDQELVSDLSRAESPPAIRLHARDHCHDLSQAEDQARQCGEEALRQGRVGLILVAGGQGSRLGFSEPKGMLPIGPVSGRTLFQLHADHIAAVQRRYGCRLPWLIMTSPATHSQTESYLRANAYLGCDREQVVTFCQGTMPAVDVHSGRILLEAKDRLFTNPDGHGGLLAAMLQANLFDWLSERNVDTLFYFQVDNPLVAIASPEFLGHHLLAGSEMTTQVVAKQDPLEKVGNLVLLDGRLRIIEYSDLPEDLARSRDAQGQLRFWAGNIAVHAFSTGFLQRMAVTQGALPFHRAIKSVPYVDMDGKEVRPVRPNAFKFERFIFDILPEAANALVVEVDPTEAFAPVKNPTGSPADTPETAQAAILAQHRRLLMDAGLSFPAEFKVELHPSLALDADELRRRVEAGLRIDRDWYVN